MRHFMTTTCAACGLLAATALVPAIAAGEKVTTIISTELEGLEGAEANIVLFEVEPGFATERHIHPGHVFVYVLEGAIEIAVDGEEKKTIAAGEAFQETPDKPMIGRNASSSEGAKFIVFQVGKAGEPLMVAHPN